MGARVVQEILLPFWLVCFFVLVDIEVFVGCFKGRIASQERGRMLFFIVQKPSSVWFAF